MKSRSRYALLMLIFLCGLVAAFFLSFLIGDAGKFFLNKR